MNDIDQSKERAERFRNDAVINPASERTVGMNENRIGYSHAEVLLHIANSRNTTAKKGPQKT
jgi:hypothetical protein